MERLSVGSRGPAVELAQSALNFQLAGIHPPLVVDGQFGDATKAATLALQVAAGLKDKDGIIGRDTNAVLFAFYELTLPMVWTRKPKPARPQLTPPSLKMPTFNLPPLTLPPLTPPPGLLPFTLPPLNPIGPFAPPPPFPGLNFTANVTQGGTSNYPARPSEVDLFKVSGKILKHFKLTLKGSVEGVSELSGEQRVDGTVGIELGLFTVGGISVSAYAKAVAELNPNAPGDSVFKGKGGLNLSLNLGRLTVEISPTADVIKINPASGEIKGGALFVGGLLTVGNF